MKPRKKACHKISALHASIKTVRATCICFLGLSAMNSCNVSRQVAKQANAVLLKDSAISSGFIGISIYEPAAGTYWYNYNATKYFTPASNTKLFSLYAGMKFLGDSLPSAKIIEGKKTLYLFPGGDPSFLNREFPFQPLAEKLTQTGKQVILVDTAWKEKALGYGWAWDDYNDDYMAERSLMPVFGNVLMVKGTVMNLSIEPRIFKDHFYWDTSKSTKGYISSVIRDQDRNTFIAAGEGKKENTFSIPFLTGRGNTNFEVLQDELRKHIDLNHQYYVAESGTINYTIHSQPTDSLFKLMMHRSDNFFAEQTLLMVSNEKLGYMNDEAIIDTLLRNDLKDIPQKPKWVDGSGLSRYNLFTPQSFIYILYKMRNEFGWNRIKNILPTGGEGTLRSYFKKDAGYIYAKTGTLSNNCALSGFLLTNKGKLLIFSILANHYQTGATPIRQATERFLEWIRKNY